MWYNAVRTTSYQNLKRRLAWAKSVKPQLYVYIPSQLSHFDDEYMGKNVWK